MADVNLPANLVRMNAREFYTSWKDRSVSIQETIAFVKSRRRAAGTEKQYKTKSKKFLEWLAESHPEIKLPEVSLIIFSLLYICVFRMMM